MARRKVFAVLVLLLVCSGLLLLYFGLRDPTNFESPVDSMTLYSLDPDFRSKGLAPRPTDELFQEHLVLGKLDIKSNADRQALLTAVSKGIAESDEKPMKCFNPRHGIRITRGSKTVDYLICFECLKLDAYVNDDLAWQKRTTKSPAVELNKHLLGAGVPLAETPEEREKKFLEEREKKFE